MYHFSRSSLASLYIMMLQSKKHDAKDDDKSRKFYDCRSNLGLKNTQQMLYFMKIILLTKTNDF